MKKLLTLLVLIFPLAIMAQNKIVIKASQVSISSLANIGAQTVVANATGSPAAPQAVQLGVGLTFSGGKLAVDTANFKDTIYALNGLQILGVGFNRIGLGGFLSQNTTISGSNAFALTLDSMQAAVGRGFRVNFGSDAGWDIPVRDSASGFWTRVGKGTVGQVLTMLGSGGVGWAASAGGSPANPTANVGLTAVNGSASTFMRSDGAPAISQSITPEWTGLHKFDVPLQINESAGRAFTFGTRTAPSLNLIPVVTFRPVANNTNLSFDLTPNGTPGAWTSVDGYTWLDVCDADILTANPGTVGTARVGNRDAGAEFGWRSFNGRVSRPVIFTMKDGTYWGMIDTVGKWGVGSVNGFGAAAAGAGAFNSWSTTLSQINAYYDATHKSQIFTDAAGDLNLVPDGITTKMPASTTAGASLNMAAGAAPTSPNNQDIWATSTHLFTRIGGVTYQLDQQLALGLTNNQNASTQIVISNNNGSGSANSEFLATNGTTNTALLHFGTGATAYGGWATSTGGIYTAASALNLMDDNASGVIKMQIGSASATDYTFDNTSISPAVTGTNDLGTSSLKFRNEFLSGDANLVGAQFRNITLVSATGTYNVTATDWEIIFTGSTATVVYPTATTGRVLYILNQASGTVTLPTTTNGNGTTTTSLTTNQMAILSYDGTVWRAKIW